MRDSSIAPTQRVLNRIMDNLVQLSNQTCEEARQVGDLILHRGPDFIPSWNIAFIRHIQGVSLSDMKSVCTRFFQGGDYRVTDLVASEHIYESGGLQQMGYHLAKELILMVMKPSKSQRESTPTRSGNVPAVTSQSIEQWTDIFASTFLARKAKEEDYVLFRKAGRVRRLVAFVGSSPAAIISYFSYKGVGQIGSVATLKEFRGRGLADYLLRYTIHEYSAKDNLLYLTVGGDNSFIEFYKRRGFKGVGRQVYHVPN